MSSSTLAPHAPHSARPAIFDDLQRGTLDYGILGADIETESDRIVHHRRQCPDLQPDADNPRSLGPFGAGLDDRIGDAQLVHR